ncbi:hypothetical protein D3C72_1431730 [compost metagenome]
MIRKPMSASNSRDMPWITSSRRNGADTQPARPARRPCTARVSTPAPYSGMYMTSPGPLFCSSVNWPDKASSPVSRARSSASFAGGSVSTSNPSALRLLPSKGSMWVMGASTSRAPSGRTVYWAKPRWRMSSRCAASAEAGSCMTSETPCRPGRVSPSWSAPT